jgi:hypothetical protein
MQRPGTSWETGTDDSQLHGMVNQFALNQKESKRLAV